MELQKDKNYRFSGKSIYEGRTTGPQEVRLFVGKWRWHSPEEGDVIDIFVDMYANYEDWDLAIGTTAEPGKVLEELEDFIKELEEVRDYMLSPRFADILKEVSDGAKENN